MTKTVEADELSGVFAALADPTRRAILARLSEGPATVGELGAPFAISKPAISQHIKVLRRAGLVEQAAQAQWRTCTLRTERLDEASEWIDRHRRLWNERFDLLDQQLQANKSEKGTKR